MHRRKLRATLAFFVAVLVLVPTLGTQTAPSRPPVARIGDQAIYEEELLPFIQSQLLQLKKQEYEIRVKALGTVLDQHLLELAARSEGISVAGLLRRVDDDLP